MPKDPKAKPGENKYPFPAKKAAAKKMVKKAAEKKKGGK